MELLFNKLLNSTLAKEGIREEIVNSNFILENHYANKYDEETSSLIVIQYKVPC